MSINATAFSQAGQTFGTELPVKKTLPLDGQNRQARSS